MSNISKSLGRRLFLQRSAALSAAAGTPFIGSLLGFGSAAAQSADHKALVCIFQAGGNDGSNTVLPASGSAYTAYAQGRGALALTGAQMQAITPAGYSGPPLAFNAQLGALRTLFGQGRVALLANVGTLVVPTTQADWNNGTPRVAVPSQLFSHSDQQGAWHTGLPDRVTSPTGWLGRIGDLTADVFNPGSGVSIAMSVAGNNIMQAGDRTIQYQLTTQGAVRVNAVTSSGGLYGSTAGSGAMRTLLTQTRTHLLENELNKIGRRAIDTEVLVTAALQGVTLATAFPDTNLGRQLRLVARMIGARGALAQRRQIFFVQSGGWDFHDNLINDQSTRLRELGDAMAAFQAAMQELAVAPQVTAFTASDFGRALQSNGRGSDHGWGGHHFVMGGAVIGNRVYGQFPTVALGGPEDAGQGRLIPTTSVDSYAATLARWFGVSDSDLATVLPNIGRFPSSNLGFMA
jgi:uncharacterized protein (DUF1501 family)